MTPKKLHCLIILNLLWSIGGIFADWNWLSQVPWYLIPFTAICSLYPPLLLVFYFQLKLNKKPPQWLIIWIMAGTFSYGLIALFYFPLLMLWRGFSWHDFLSIFWVATYGLQFLVIRKFLRNLRFTDLLPGLIFIATAGYFHYTYPTFVDFLIPNYPLSLKYFTLILTISLQGGFFLFLLSRLFKRIS